MEALVRFSFYCFTAATIAMVAATICYIAAALGSVRIRQSILQTGTGVTVSAASAERVPASFDFGRWGTSFAWFALGFQFFSVLFRTVAGGRIPLSNMYEFSLSFLFLILLVYMIFERAYGVRHLGAIVLPIAVGMAAYVWSLPAALREVNPLQPALQHITLMTFHVSMALLAYSTFAVAFAAAALYLVVSHWQVRWLPAADLLDDLGFRAVTVGFPALALVLIIGSIWAHQAWGAYWSWDPKETAALFTWLIYAVYLHTRTLRGWRGNRSAWILIIGFAAAIFTYYGNYFFGGMHAYGGV